VEILFLRVFGHAGSSKPATLYPVALSLLCTFVDERADVQFESNSDGGVDDVRRLEPGTSQLAADSRAHQRVDLGYLTWGYHSRHTQ